MAIWQFDVALVPTDGPLPRRTEDGHDCPPLLPANAAIARAWLRDRGGEPWQMCEDWWVFGVDTGSRFDVLVNHDGSAEVSARIDARSPYQEFAGSVCELALATHCTLFSAEHWQTIGPLENELSKAIERSRAVAYVRNPMAVLRGEHNAG